VAGRYRIRAISGIGGMGVVYLARDEELDQDVALKVLRPDLGTDPEWIARFRRELVLARQVSHPNVVRIHDIGESDGLRFLTMRHVEGRSLLQVLDSEGPLPLPRATAILRQMAEALQAAHDAGVVHRDLKPGNVLLEADDTAYVTDFGVARSLQRDALTRSGVLVGTPDYLSPEQVRGDTVDGRSDVYALGIVFYEMLTNELPFKGGSAAEMVAQRVTGRVRDIRETDVRVPDWVRDVLRRCLERDPARRYQSPRELVADLDARRATPRAGRRVARTAVLAGLVAVAALAWGLRRPRPAPVPEAAPAAVAGPLAATPAAAGPRHAVAVLPLADETGDPALSWTATGAAEMLAASLAESPDLRVLDPQRVFRTLRDLQLAGGRYDEATLRRLATLLEVDRLVAGSVRKAGPTTRLDVRLASTGPGGGMDTRHLGAESAEEGGLFALVSGLGEQLRAALGAGPPVGTETPAPETRSLEAARAFREGGDLLRQGDAVRAAPLLEKAVAADAGFAAALERLSEAYRQLGRGEDARTAAERAAQAAEPTEARLLHRIRARQALLAGDPAGAERSHADLARRYPNDTEILHDLAAAQAAQGDLSRAVETLRKITTLDRQDPRAWFLLGKNTILMGDARQAVDDHLVRALALQNQLRNEQGQGDVLNAMGVGYQKLGDHAQALEKYSAAAALRRKLGDERGIATSLKNRARIYVAMGRLAEAEPDLVAARRLYERIGDENGLADVLNEFGVLHEGRGEYAKALAAYQDGLKVRRSLGDKRQIAQSYDNVGYIFFLQGEYDNALVYWKQALDLRRTTGDKGGVVLSTQNLGFLQTVQGRWDEAVKSFVEALDGSRELDFKSAMAVSHGNLGVLHQYEGRYGAAFTSYGEALALLKPLEDKRGLAEYTLKEAAALLDVGRLDDAKARLDMADAWVQETGNREQASDHAVLLGEWHARRGEAEQAREAAARGLREAQASHSRSAILRARIAEGRSRPDAAVVLTAVSRDAESLGDVVLRIRAAEALAGAEEARGRLTQGEAAARRALRVAQDCGYEAGLYRLHALLGRILGKRGEAAAAAAQYVESARSMARVREGMSAEHRAAFDALDAVREVAAAVPPPSVAAR
jgi:eukaryotic-like serine/threonine-protein kinase